MPVEASPQFALLLQLLDHPVQPADPAAVRAAAPISASDWDGFARLLRRHRVTRRAVGVLTAAGVSVPETLGQRASAAGLSAMQQLAETERVQSALATHGIRSLALKGPVLSLTLYHDPAYRESKDIDLLVARDDFETALQVLRNELDFRCHTAPPLGTDRYAMWLDWNKDVALASPRGPLLELHHRLTAVACLLPSIGLDQAVDSVTIGPKSFAQLDRASLFTYLCVHGAASRWHRLTWLADIRTMLAPATEAELTQWHAQACGHGVGRCALSAMMLCRTLWGQPLPQVLVAAAARDSRLGAIVANSLTTIADDNPFPSTARGRAFVSNALLLRDDRGYRRAVLKEWMFDPALVSKVAVPHRLRLLYVPLRLGLWVQRKIAKLFG